jgi:hypothetical protein
MFTDWEDYANHLAENLIQDTKNKVLLKKIIIKKKDIYNGMNIYKKFWRVIINTILSSDWDFTKIANFECTPDVFTYRKYKKSVIDKRMLSNTNAFTETELNDLKNKIYGNL